MGTICCLHSPLSAPVINIIITIPGVVFGKKKPVDIVGYDGGEMSVCRGCFVAYPVWRSHSMRGYRLAIAHPSPRAVCFSCIRERACGVCLVGFGRQAFGYYCAFG